MLLLAGYLMTGKALRMLAEKAEYMAASGTPLDRLSYSEHLVIALVSLSWLGT